MPRKKIPVNEVTAAPINTIKKAKPGTKKTYAARIPKTPVKDIAFKIATTGIPSELLESHLENIANPVHFNAKPKKEIGIRMLFCLADGWSLGESALLCGISADTIYNFWGNPKSKYFDETFSKIISLGIHLSELWWVSMGRANLLNKKEFDSTLWMMNMSNRFGWTRKLDGKIIEKWETVTKEAKTTFVKTISHKTIMEASNILKEIGITVDAKNAETVVETTAECQE